MIKDSSISTVRLISLIMIISCHILQGLNNETAFWLNLGVQIFFFMSGYLYGKKEICNYLTYYKTRLINILIPTTIIVSIMCMLEKAILHINYSNSYIILNLIGLGGFFGNLQTLTHTWFVSYILICYLITPILQKLFKKDNNIETLFIAIITLILFRHFCIISINHVWIINYILGYFFSRCCITEKHQKYFLAIIIILSALMFPLALLVRYNLTSNVPVFILYFKNQIWDWEHVFLGTLLFIVFYNIASRLNIKYNMILKFSDKYSFFIYLTHQIFILNQFSVLNLTNNMFINIFLIFILSILSGVLLYYLYQILYTFINFSLKKINKKSINSLD